MRNPKALMRIISLTLAILLGLAIKLIFAQTLVTADDVEITITEGANLTIYGGIKFDLGTEVHNDGTIAIKQNSGSDGENWWNDAGTHFLKGNGIVEFSSSEEQIIGGQFNSAFHTLKFDNSGTGISLDNNVIVNHELHLTDGLVKTFGHSLELTNPSPGSILGYSQSPNTASYVVGNLTRKIGNNKETYAWPVGSLNTYNLIEVENNNIEGPDRVTGTFAPLHNHNDSELTVEESGNRYEKVADQGVWNLEANGTVVSGSFNLKAYIYHFNGIADNTFAILKRPLNSNTAADWDCENCGIGKGLSENNGQGRLIRNEHAYRKGLTRFNQVGVGQVAPSQVELPESVVVCDVETTIHPINTAFESFQWSTGENGDFATVNHNMKTVSVLATDLWGFVSTDESEVLLLSPPSAFDDQYEIKQNASRTFYVTDNDNYVTDVQIDIVANPTNGNVTINNDGSINYTPNGGFSGRDIFTYEICMSSPDCGQLCDSGDAIIDVLRDNILVIPQALSPNNDGFNDRWVIEGIENYPNNEVTIYNRWGNIIFKANGYDNQQKVWDGLAKEGLIMGKNVVPSGSYYYVLNLGNGEKPISGYIALINK